MFYFVPICDPDIVSILRVFNNGMTMPGRVVLFYIHSFFLFWVLEIGYMNKRSYTPGSLTKYQRFNASRKSPLGTLTTLSIANTTVQPPGILKATATYLGMIAEGILHMILVARYLPIFLYIIISF